MSSAELSLFSFLRDAAAPPPDAIKPEPEAESTTTPDDSVDLKVKHEDVKEEVGVKEEEADAVELTPALTTLRYMYGPDQATRWTDPKSPHTTRFPDFPSLPRRMAPHPLDRSTWFKPELSFPPPSNLLTLDEGNKSLFDVDFRRQPKSDIGGNAQDTAQVPARLLCFTGWNMPTNVVGNEGGPYYILAPSEWVKEYKALETVAAAGGPEAYKAALKAWDKLTPSERNGKSPPELHNGSMSLFYGGGGKKAHTWRYRGDVKIHERIDILPEHFAAMGEEEKEQWINYFRFENVLRRLNGRIPEQRQLNSVPKAQWRGVSPNDFFEYLSQPDSPKLILTVLRVVGYDEDRINRWMDKRKQRLRKPALDTGEEESSDKGASPDEDAVKEEESSDEEEISSKPFRDSSALLTPKDEKDAKPSTMRSRLRSAAPTPHPTKKVKREQS